MALGELAITLDSLDNTLLVKNLLTGFHLTQLHAVIKCISEAKLNWMKEVTSKDVLLNIHSYHDECCLFFSSL